MMTDPLAHALSKIKNAENAGKKEVVIKPSSKLIAAVLNILKAENYIKDFKVEDNNRGGEIKVKLANVINNVGVIRPRYTVSISDLEKFENRYLPARGFGRLIISTSKGIVTHIDARAKKTGGTLIAYVY